MDAFESVPFGDLMKIFRKQRHISQRELSEKLGVHYNTISKWERGMCLPDSKGMVLELAKELRLDEHEARALLEASLTALSPYWSIPYPRNSLFTGREEILEALHRHLSADQVASPLQLCALRGLGGIGKTQIALEYAYRYALEYSAIFWLGAETAESIVSSMLDVAEALQLPERGDKNRERVVAAVQHWLSRHQRWLLIWDNLEDLDLLQRFLPSTRQGAVLLTTCQQALGIFVRGIDLLPMKQEEGRLFLLRRAKLLEPETAGEQQVALSMPAEHAAASDLVTAMGGLPLALDQVGAYIEESGCSLSVYLQRYKQQRVRLLDRRGPLGKDHPHSVTTTFRLASERMKQEPQAMALLKVCAFLHAEAIPEELFVAGAQHLGPELASLATDSSQFDQAIAVLRSFSLVERQAETSTHSLHRLVQIVLRALMNEQEQALWLRRVIKALNAVFPEVIYEVWKQCERLLPHVLAVAAAIPDQECDLALVEALRKAATYLRARAQYKQAEPLYRRALRIGEQALGPVHPDIAHLLNGLALLYTEQGKDELAEPLYQKALRIGERALGPEHLDIAHLLNGLATFYWKQGKYEQAKPLYERALHIREDALGAEHPETTNLLNGLAFLYLDQGENQQAKLLCWRVLYIWERALEVEHPEQISLLDMLADFRGAGWEEGQEESRYKQALHVWKQVGVQYPHVAYPLYGLGVLCGREGKGELAISFYKCALSMAEQAVGPEHPELVYPLNGLANLYQGQGKYEQAGLLYRRALRIREQHLGKHHPETARALYDLAIFYQKQGNTGEALSLAERALKICTQLIREQTYAEQRESAQQGTREHQDRFNLIALAAH